MFSQLFGSYGDRRVKHRKTFRPQLECLEARTMLDGSGMFASLSNDLNQLQADVGRLQVASIKQDVVKLGNDVNAIINQLRNSPAIDMVSDVKTILWGAVDTQIGASMVAAGAASSETGAGIALIAAGTTVFAYGVNLQVTGAQKFMVDLNRLLSGGDQAEVSPPAVQADQDPDDDGDVDMY